MKNGLYSIHVTLLDGRVGKGSGVILFRDGQILGGDAYLFYTGSYTVKGDTFKGEVLVQRHTSSPDANPLFGGPNPVGIGVSGTFTGTRATMNGTALVGKAASVDKVPQRAATAQDKAQRFDDLWSFRNLGFGRFPSRQGASPCGRQLRN